MGTRVAPTYAVIFMNHFEETKIYGQNNLKHWFRFIDDVWEIYSGTKAELLQFFDYCNSLHETIKFSFEFSKCSIDFLDMTTYVENHHIYTKPFFKSNETHSYLDYSSCHLIHNRSSIPYSQFLRM